MKVLFLGSEENIYRCIIAQNILQSIDSNLQVFSAVLGTITRLDEKSVHAMSILGYQITNEDIKSFDDFKDVELDYLILLSNELRGLLKKYPVNYKFKLHMEFNNPYIENQSDETVKKTLASFREEIENEMNYFYYHILKEKAAI